ncbi:MAG TPA: ROK family protein [Candidatus Sulfotelmatobacter sp.]|nr:ROK family protein [Candidatus Sulfotelmatobacter sp.]
MTNTPAESPKTNRGYVLGVDIGGSNLRIALAEMNGKILGKRSASTRETTSPEAVVEKIHDAAEQLLQESLISHGSLLAVAAGAPGITNADCGIVIATSFLKGWRDVPLRSLLESALRVPAAVENDVRVAAIGEHWAGSARGIKNFVFLALGTGIAAGIFVDGKLVRGPDWAAGEVGYMHVPGTPEEPAERGAPGSLESTIGGDGIRQQWLRCCRDEGVSLTGDLSATEIFELGCAGDAQAAKVLKYSAQTLGYAVYNISLVLNSTLVVLGGGVGMSEPLREATQRFLDRYTEPTPPKVIISSLGQDAQLMGAVRLALDTAELRNGVKT